MVGRLLLLLCSLLHLFINFFWFAQWPKIVFVGNTAVADYDNQDHQNQQNSGISSPSYFSIGSYYSSQDDQEPSDSGENIVVGAPLKMSAQPDELLDSFDVLRGLAHLDSAPDLHIIGDQDISQEEYYEDQQPVVTNPHPPARRSSSKRQKPRRSKNRKVHQEKENCRQDGDQNIFQDDRNSRRSHPNHSKSHPNHSKIMAKGRNPGVPRTTAQDRERRSHQLQQKDKELAAANAKIANLEAQVQQLIAQQRANVSRVAAANPSALVKNDGMSSSVKTVTKDIVFRLRKFFRNQEELKEATKLALPYVIPPKDLEDWSDEYKERWVETYKEDVKSETNKIRSYIQSRAKDIAMAWMDNNGGEMITSEMVMKCATRDLDLNDEQQRGAFLWYWDELLPVIGGHRGWGNEIKKYSTISEALVDKQLWHVEAAARQVCCGGDKSHASNPQSVPVQVACARHCCSWANQ